MMGETFENKSLPVYRIIEGFIIEVKRFQRSSQVHFPSR